MKDEAIRLKWEEFVKEYLTKPSKKSVHLKPKKDSTTTSNTTRKNSDYQDLGRKMSTQKSTTTSEMFQTTPDLWHTYHESRDFSFKGYDEQTEIPINKILNYVKTKSNRKLRVLDLGCGRNVISEHFKEHTKINVTGYDHISYNNSIACDISHLPNDNESVNMCIFSQSLMGSNWKEYLQEAKRVLTYCGEMIISESSERYDKIKEYIVEMGLHIKQEEYNENKRWFYIYAIND